MPNRRTNVYAVSWQRNTTEEDINLQFGVEYHGHNLNNGTELVLNAASDCKQACKNLTACQGFTWFSEEYSGQWR